VNHLVRRGSRTALQSGRRACQSRVGMAVSGAATEQVRRFATVGLSALAVHVVEGGVQCGPVCCCVQAVRRQAFGYQVKPDAQVIGTDGREPAGAQPHRARRSGLIEVTGHHRRGQWRLGACGSVRGLEFSEVRVTERAEIAVLPPRASAARASAVFDLAHVARPPARPRDWQGAHSGSVIRRADAIEAVPRGDIVPRRCDVAVWGVVWGWS
jgi:hypothetical protein